MTDLYTCGGCGDPIQNPPAHHSADPPTSRLALDTHEQTGRRELHKAIVLELVRRHPLRTAIELWNAASDEERAALKEPQETRRRLHDLNKTGKVHQRAARLCAVRSTRMVTWEAV